MPVPARVPPSILDKIVAQRRIDVAAAMAAVPEAELRARIARRAPANDFRATLRAAAPLAVLAEFKKQLGRDRTKVSVSGFTQLGLIELTRKRTRESLSHLLCEPCPTCKGKGQVKTARSICYDILREILREAKQFNPKEFRVIASAAVVEMLLDEESAHLAGLSDFIGKPISLRAESTGSPEQYDIVLM
jgi:ribonuclease G